jgi:DNA polymerase elongation subunit (family B)
LKKGKKTILDIETTAFIPWEPGRIIVIGHKDLQTNKTTTYYDQDEKTLLKEYIENFEKEKYTEIIGFNVNYDLRFILSRLLQYNISAPLFMHAKPTDLMAILKGPLLELNFNKCGTLNQWSQLILQKTKLFYNTEIPNLYQQGRIQDILRYNENDLELTYELYQRIQNVMGGNTG